MTLLADSDGSCSLTTFANCDVVVIDGNTGPSAPATVKDLDGALDDEILFQAVTTEFSKVRVSADADFFPPFSGLDYVWDIEGGAGETLMVWISETDYDAPIGDLLALVEADGNTVSTFDSDVTIQAWIDDGNNLFGMGCSVGSDSDTDGNTDIDATINGSCVGIGDPYALTLKITFACGTNGCDTTGDLKYELIVPEPSTMALFGSGLMFLGLMGVRRRRRG